MKNKKILQEKRKQSESFECSGKKAKLTNRLVVFRKQKKGGK